MNKSLLICVFSLLTLTAHSAVLSGPKLFDDLTFGTSGTEAQLGYHMANDNNMAAITMPVSGDVLVYTYDGVNWEFDSSFNAVKTSLFYPFNNKMISSIAIKGNRIVVGSIEDDNIEINSGAVYIYEKQNNDWILSQKIKANNPIQSAAFGFNVALADDRIMVQSLIAEVNGVNLNAVYVFTLDNSQWIQSQVLTASDSAVGDGFGSSISVSDDLLLIGAPYNNYNAARTGAAYMFEFDGQNYVESQKLLGSSSAATSLFGSEVDLQGDVALIGAPQGFNESFLRTGAVYVFRNDGNDWLFEDKVSAGAQGEEFGQNVLINNSQVLVIGNSGVFTFKNILNDWIFEQWIMQSPSSFVVFNDSLLLGFPLYDNNFDNEGKVGIYKMTQDLWDFSSNIYGLESHENEWFGYSLDVMGDEMLVGVPRDKDDYISLSSVRVLEKNANDWQSIDTLIPSDSNENIKFGTAVNLSNDKAFISASEAENPGSVYFYSKIGNSWIESQKLTASDGFIDDKFGDVVVLNGDFLFINAGTNPSSFLSAVYVFKFNGSDWVEIQKLESGVQFDGFGSELIVSDAQILIRANDNPQNQLGPVHVYEEVSTDQWQLTQSLQRPTGLPLSTSVGSSMGVDNDWLVLSGTESDVDFSGFLTVQSSIHAYQKVNGIWNYKFSEDIPFTQSGASYKFDLALADGEVYFAVRAGSKNFDRSSSYFYELGPESFSLSSSFFGESQYNTARTLKITVKLENQMAYLGAPWDFKNGKNAGAVMTFDLDPPDEIFLNGFE